MSNLDKNLGMVEASIHVTLNQLKRYNVVVNGKRTSVTLEPKIWDVLKEICKEEGVTTHELCHLIATRRGEAKNLSSAIRVFLISYLDSRYKYNKNK